MNYFVERARLFAQAKSLVTWGMSQGLISYMTPGQIKERLQKIEAEEAEKKARKK
jgi:hypothetical protein